MRRSVPLRVLLLLPALVALVPTPAPSSPFTVSGFDSPADSVRAVEDLRRRVREDRRDKEARRDLAGILGRSRDIEERREAVKALTEAILIDDDDPDLWVMMARLQERRGFRRESRNAYHTALEMLPERADLWCELSQHEFFRYQRSKRDEYLVAAIDANRKALDEDPRNPDAIRRAIRIAFIQSDMVRVDSLCSVWETSSPGDAWPALVRGMIQTRHKSWEEAWDSFQRGLSLLGVEERKPFVRLDIVDPVEEEKRQEAKPDTTRYFEDYWRWRDPTPSDPVNPRLVEHYSRMVEAELLFALDQLHVRGWDHAPGELIVRYGIGEEWNYDRDVRRMKDYRGSSTTFAAPSIQVRYGGKEDQLAFSFVDYNLSGRFFSPIEAFPSDADFFMVADPSLYQAPLGAKELQQDMELWRFMDGKGNGRIEVAVALPPDIWPAGALERPHRLASKFTLYDQTWDIQDSGVGSWAVFEPDPLGRLVGIFELGGSEDSVIVGLETSDREKEGRAAGYLTLPPHEVDSGLVLSDLAFLSRVRFDEPGGIYRRGYGSGIPNPGHYYYERDPIGLAFEAYGLTVGGDGSSRARIRITVGRQTRDGWLNVLLRRGQNPPEAELVFEAGDRGSRLPQILSVDVPDLDPGSYELRVEVEDLASGERVQGSSTFVVLEEGKLR